MSGWLQLGRHDPCERCGAVVAMMASISEPSYRAWVELDGPEMLTEHTAERCRARR